MEGWLIMLAVLLLITGGGLGFGWWLAARDRYIAKGDLRAEQGVSAQLCTGIDTENMAILGLGCEKQLPRHAAWPRSNSLRQTASASTVH